MSHWSKIKEKKTSDRGLFFLFKIYEYLGVKPLKLALYPIIFLFFIIDSNIRKVSYKYLSYIYTIKKKNGEYFPTPTLWHVFNTYLFICGYFKNNCHKVGVGKYSPFFFFIV